MITGINESKTLAAHISCKCKCRFDGKNVIQFNGGITINVDLSEKYLASIMDKIICDEIIDIKETNFNEKNVTCKTQNFYILLTFSLITITFLIAVSIYCYLIKY